MGVPWLVPPWTVARLLRRLPPAPTRVVRLLMRAEAELAFRELVRRLLPGEAAAILSARRPGGDAEAECVWAFCAAVERLFFPVYECDEMEHVLACIPFTRFGWSYDHFHDLDQRPGTLLLRALCAEPYEGTVGARVVLLEAVEGLGIARELLLRLPSDGLAPQDLHRALAETPYAAAADFADWTWGQTDLAFLDCDDDTEVYALDWTDDNVQELARQWRSAEALMERVTALANWLEQAPADNFARLLEAALAAPPDPTVPYAGGPHAHELTALAPVSRVAEPVLALPPPAAA